jgi:hypothetical protein
VGDDAVGEDNRAGNSEVEIAHASRLRSMPVRADSSRST